MNGNQMHKIRIRLGLLGVAGMAEFAYAVGYSGPPLNVVRLVRRFENDERSIPPWIERLVLMFDAFGIPDGWTKEA